MNFTNKTYDLLKDIAQLWLPALATLITATFAIWGLPYGEPIGATIMAIDVFLGTVLKISNKNYLEDMEDKKEE